MNSLPLVLFVFLAVSLAAENQLDINREPKLRALEFGQKTLVFQYLADS